MSSDHSTAKAKKSRIVSFCFEATRVGMTARVGQLNEADKIILAKSVMDNMPDDNSALRAVVSFLATVGQLPEEAGDLLQSNAAEIAHEHCPSANIGMGDLDLYRASDWRERADLA